MDMKGKFPVRSLYATPDILLANAPKQNTFAIDSSLGMMSAWLHAQYAGPWYCGGSTKIGKMIGASFLIVVGIFIILSLFFGSGFRVLLIPCFGHFMWPFAVAGLGFKYFTTSSWLRLGHPLRNPRCIALMRDDIVGLHNDWCAYFMVLACVRMECVNVAISINLGVICRSWGTAGHETYRGSCVTGLIWLHGQHNRILGRSVVFLVGALHRGWWVRSIDQCSDLCSLIK